PPAPVTYPLSLTRRSSDLGRWEILRELGELSLPHLACREVRQAQDVGDALALHERADGIRVAPPVAVAPAWIDHVLLLQGAASRSEEHTSELQSRSDLVCR